MDSPYRHCAKSVSWVDFRIIRALLTDKHLEDIGHDNVLHSGVVAAFTEVKGLILYVP